MEERSQNAFCVFCDLFWLKTNKTKEDRPENYIVTVKWNLLNQRKGEKNYGSKCKSVVFRPDVENA